MTDVEKLQIKLEIWKKIIDVQMHFNELEMKIRNFAILLLSALIGAAALALKENITFTSWGLSLTSLLLFTSSLFCMIFFCADLFWYHRLLKGAVIQGIAVEKSITDDGFPEVNLSTAIGNSSKMQVKYFNKPFDSNRKIKYFYISIASIFFLLGVISLTLPSTGKSIPVMPQSSEPSATPSNSKPPTLPVPSEDSPSLGGVKEITQSTPQQTLPKLDKGDPSNSAEKILTSTSGTSRVRSCAESLIHRYT